MSGEIERPDWGKDGDDGQGSGRAGAGHVEPESNWTPVGDPKKGAQRYSGALADLDDGKEAPGQELEPANPQEVTQEERQEIVEGIEARAEPPAEYDDLSTSTKELIDAEGYANILHEQEGVREHLSHDEQDELNEAIEGLPAALDKKLTVAVASGEFENLQELAEHLADGLSAKQMGHLRRAIEEMPARVREEIDI